jgi:hypothetical protein
MSHINMVAVGLAATGPRPADCSGGIEGRPITEYSLLNAGDRRSGQRSPMGRITHSGCSAPSSLGSSTIAIALAESGNGEIHLKTDFDGLPIAFHLTGGEASDSTQLATFLDIGPDITLRAVMTDKGYDAKSNRAACRDDTSFR